MNKPAKQYYATYLADDNLSEINHRLVYEVLKLAPKSVFEYGMGTGKNLKAIQGKNPEVFVTGVDVSYINVIHAMVKNGLNHVSLGDEYDLPFKQGFDVAITCSCLDHIADVDQIITDLKRIADKAVIIAECTSHDPSVYYWAHNYEGMGFQKISEPFVSAGDGREYFIYKWTRTTIDRGANDDKA